MIFLAQQVYLLCSINHSRVEIINEEQRLAKFKDLVNALPKENFFMLGRLMQLFRLIVTHNEITKMTAANVSISFGMNLMREREENPLKLAQGTWCDK